MPTRKTLIILASAFTLFFVILLFCVLGEEATVPFLLGVFFGATILSVIFLIIRSGQ